MLESPKSSAFSILFGIILGSTTCAADSLLITDIPADVIAIESKVLNHTIQYHPSNDTKPDLARLRGPVVQYERAIEELQKSHGVYHDRIGEQLLGLGLAHKNLKHYKEAIEAFNRSLHINRINQGLHNANQLATLELIIETNTALSDWQALDQNYHYLYWVNRRTYGEDDPRLLPVIDRLGRWHLNAYSQESDPVPFKHLLTADDLFHDAVNIIETKYGPNDPRLINALYGIVMTNYQMAFHATQANDFNEISFSSRSTGRRERMLEEQEARQEVISDSYRVGKKAMLRIIDIYVNNSELPTDAHGIALIHLGDWYLLFNRRMTASETYEIAYTKLTESSMDKVEINKLLGQPRSLPALRLPIEYQKKEVNSSYVIAIFDVSKSGQARNIKIIESNPADNQLLRRRAKKTIRATRFRPRFEDGQPVATAGVNIRYEFQE